MNNSTWTQLTRLDLHFGVSIVINVKGRNANLSIGQTPSACDNGEPSTAPVHRYMRQMDNEQISDLAAGLKLANERIAEHQIAWDAQHKRDDRTIGDRKGPRSGVKHAKPAGLRELAKRDASKISPEAAAEVARKQRDSKKPPRDRSLEDQQIRSRMKGSAGAKPR